MCTLIQLDNNDERWACTCSYMVLERSLIRGLNAVTYFSQQQEK